MPRRASRKLSHLIRGSHSWSTDLGNRRRSTDHPRSSFSTNARYTPHPTSRQGHPEETRNPLTAAKGSPTTSRSLARRVVRDALSRILWLFSTFNVMDAVSDVGGSCCNPGSGYSNPVTEGRGGLARYRKRLFGLVGVEIGIDFNCESGIRYSVSYYMVCSDLP